MEKSVPPPSSSEKDAGAVPVPDRTAQVEQVIWFLEGGQLKKAAKVAEVDEWGMAGLRAAFGELPKVLESVPEDELPSVRVAGAAMFLLGLRTPPAVFGRRRRVGPRFDFEAAARMVRNVALLAREVAACRALGFPRVTVHGRTECCEACRTIPQVIGVDEAPRLLQQDCTAAEGCCCWISPELE